MSKCDLNKVTLQPKPHFGMGVQICSIFSEHLFLRTPWRDASVSSQSKYIFKVKIKTSEQIY